MTCIVFHWDGKPRPDLEPKVIEQLMDDMGCETESELSRTVDGLIFSTVLLTDAWDGPSVTAWGQSGHAGNIWAVFHDATQWVPMEAKE